MGAANLPLSFSEILGQDKAKQRLERLLASERLGHAYLFRGPDGVGKQRFAQAVAIRINCRQTTGNHEDPCGSCPSCLKYRSGNHPDITVIRPEGGTIKIDRVRELCRGLSYPPYESVMRIVIIEDVHTMRPEAANSLLKTLEEPPENNLLILTAESSRTVLPTIVSRCQLIPFYGLTLEQTKSILIQQCPEMHANEAELLSRLAEGSPGQALHLSRYNLVEIQQEVVSAISASPKDRGATITILELADKLAELKENLIPLIGLLRLWVRDQMVGGTSHARVDVMKNQSRLAALQRAEHQLERNCNRSLVCEVLLFNLQSPQAGVSSSVWPFER